MDENEKPINKSDLLEQLDRHLDWIKSCDTKSSIVLAVIGISLTIFTTEQSINMLNQIISKTIQHISFSNFLYLLLFVLSWSLFIYGGYCLIRVLAPRLSKELTAHQGISIDSLYFFQTVANNSFTEFENKVKNQSKEEDIKDILSQVYVNAKICTIKYSFYNRGIKYTFIGISSVLTLYIIGIILIKLDGF